MSHQINIDKNGTTTLATAGKYCDRNIDVNVSVPSSGTELINGFIERTIAGHYENNEVLSVGIQAFAYCSQLESVVFNKAEILSTYAFSNCTMLKRAEFANIDSSKGIYTNCFVSCTALEKVVLRAQSVCKLQNTSAFNGSGVANGTGYIYVPDDLVDNYKTATNWVTYASQIKPISELEE